jgi:hypothetical protein
MNSRALLAGSGVKNMSWAITAMLEWGPLKLSAVVISESVYKPVSEGGGPVFFCLHPWGSG